MKWFVGVAVWVLATLLTLGLLVYQRLTGPTYPLKVSGAIAGKTVEGKLIRTHETNGPAAVRLVVPEDWNGTMVWRKYPSEDSWSSAAMAREGKELVAYLPQLPAAGKVEYTVRLGDGRGGSVVLPQDGSAVLRYKGPVPSWLLGLHIVFIFLAPLMAFRSTVGRIFRVPGAEKFVPWLVLFMAIGGFWLGPWMQLHAFGAWWTGWPFGEDLTDNKTLFAFLFWAVACWGVWKQTPWRTKAFWIALFVMLAVYLVPHSMRGSQIDWSKVDQQEKSL